MQLCIFEDQHFSNFFPLVYFRPVYALRCGGTKLREKIERLVPRAEVVYHARPELADYLREKSPGRAVNTLRDEPTWFVNGRVVANESLQRLLRSVPKGDVAYWHEGDVVAAYAGSRVAQQWQEAVTGGPITGDHFQTSPREEIDVKLIRYPWELVHRNADAIVADYSGRFKAKRPKAPQGKVYPGVSLVNRNNIVIGRGSVVKPQVVLDAENGPIIIGESVTIYPHAFVEGPAYIGDGSVIKAGAKIYGGTTIGEVCKVGGEVEASIIHSYSNKQHEGFLGHSYLGSWVNIGADTNTSNLKNTYGTVEVSLNGERLDTGLQFVGLFMGDHSKTGINVMFDTGTLVGASCNVYGAGLPPKLLPSFSWGNISSAFTAYRIEQSIDTARKVMARRNVPWTQAYERLFRTVFEATTGDRARQRIF